MYVPTGTPQASPQARELGGRIAGVIQDYLSQNPGLGKLDVIQAFEVARSLLPPGLAGGAQRQRLLIAISLGLLVLGVLAALLLARGG
jgi:hypothetical protein